MQNARSTIFKAFQFYLTTEMVKIRQRNTWCAFRNLIEDVKSFAAQLESFHRCRIVLFAKTFNNRMISGQHLRDEFFSNGQKLARCIALRIDFVAFTRQSRLPFRNST